MKLIKLLFCGLFVTILFCKNAKSQICKDSCCIVNLNSDTTYQAAKGQAAIAFRYDILPSVFAIVTEHIDAYGEYEIPFDTLAKATGLYTLLNGNILFPCCRLCPNKECAANVKFVRMSSSDTARFIIQLKNLASKKYIVRNSRGNTTVEFSMDTITSGKALISPNSLKFYFSDNYPRIIISEQNSQVIDINIRCISVSSNRIVYMPAIARPFAGSSLPIIIYK